MQITTRCCEFLDSRILRRIENTKFLLWLITGSCAGWYFKFGILPGLLLGLFLAWCIAVVVLFRDKDNIVDYDHNNAEDRILLKKYGVLRFSIRSIGADIEILLGCLLFVSVAFVWAVIVASVCFVIRLVFQFNKILGREVELTQEYEEFTNEIILFWLTAHPTARSFQTFCFGFSAHD